MLTFSSTSIDQVESNRSTAGWNKMPSSCHINPVWYHSEQAEDAQSSHVSPPSTPWMLVWAHNMLCFDRLHFPMQMWFGEKLWAISGENGSSKGSVPRYTNIQAQLSALLSKNRHKFSARRHKRHLTRGATTSSLLFTSLCNDFILRLQGLFFSPFLCAPGHEDSTTTYTLNSRWQCSIITQECNGCHMGLCSIQLFTGPAEQ